MFRPCTYKFVKDNCSLFVLFFQLVVEAAAVATLAAAMSDKSKQMDPNMQNIGIILCG